jgi:hypothetical protein
MGAIRRARTRAGAGDPGANSDILSQATANAMRARHPDFECIEVADQGHVPLLEGDELLGRIAVFVRKCERGAARDLPSG